MAQAGFATCPEFVRQAHVWPILDAHRVPRVQRVEHRAEPRRPREAGAQHAGRWTKVGVGRMGFTPRTPVLMCPGAALSRHLGISARAVAALGVLLISVDRLGLGASTPARGRTLADFAADVGELIELRGLGRPALIGTSQGAPFALACAASGITRALALVSASDEVAAPEFRSALPLHLRDLLALVATDPDGATAVLRRFDADAMWDLVMTGAPACDRAVYRAKSFERAYRTALREGSPKGRRDTPATPCSP
jgi:pimeloyl-ACP methyl ester carboxylesterase